MCAPCQSPKTSCLTSTPLLSLCPTSTLGMPYPRALALVYGIFFPSMLSASWQLPDEGWSKWMILLSCVTLGSYLTSWCPSNPQVQRTTPAVY